MSDWIEWHGGEQPVADDVVVEVVLAYETIENHDPSPGPAVEWSWRHYGNGGDIIAYRIVSQDSELDRLRKENAALRKALQELNALVWGEAPSLLNEDSGGDGTLAVEIEALLKV